MGIRTWLHKRRLKKYITQVVIELEASISPEDRENDRFMLAIQTILDHPFMTIRLCSLHDEGGTPGQGAILVWNCAHDLFQSEPDDGDRQAEVE